MTAGGQGCKLNVGHLEHRCPSKVAKGIKIEKRSSQVGQYLCGEVLGKLGNCKKPTLKVSELQSNMDYN